MRLLRLMAICVVLLVLVGGILGTACAGKEGEQGLKGDTGAAGVGIQNIVNNGDGTFAVNLTDGQKFTTDNFTGPQGIQGLQGLTVLHRNGPQHHGQLWPHDRHHSGTRRYARLHQLQQWMGERLQPSRRIRRFHRKHLRHGRRLFIRRHYCLGSANTAW